MADIRMFKRGIGKNREDIEQFLLYANHQSPVFIGHLRNIVFPKLKLVYFTLMFMLLFTHAYGKVKAPAIPAGTFSTILNI